MRLKNVVICLVVMALCTSVFVIYNFNGVQFLVQLRTLLMEKEQPKWVNIVKFTNRNHSFFRGTLRGTNKPLTIYLHSSGDLISHYIERYATWEPHLLSQFIEYIRANPGIQILDIGCNLGVYSLTAAALGSRVVAVDANYINTDRLVQSCIANKLTDKVTVVLNAIGSTRNEFVLTNHPYNIGGQSIVKNNNDSRRVKGIAIDDLVPLFSSFQPIMMKIDVEGKEIDAFQNVTRLFDERHVALVMIEWFGIKNMMNIEGLMDILTSRRYKPYSQFKPINELNLTLFKLWPVDVIWIKM